MNRNLQIELVSIDTYSPYMEVKYINVNIVNRNIQKHTDVLTNTQSPYMKVKHFNVNIAGIKQQQKVISILTYCPNKGGLLNMRGKRFLYF